MFSIDRLLLFYVLFSYNIFRHAYIYIYIIEVLSQRKKYYASYIYMSIYIYMKGNLIDYFLTYLCPFSTTLKRNLSFAR